MLNTKMEPQSPGMATDVLCKMFSSKFTGVDKEELDLVVTAVRSLKQFYGDNNAGTFKVILSILYEYCTAVSSNPNSADFHKTAKYIRMLIGDRPELASYVISILPRPDSQIGDPAVRKPDQDLRASPGPPSVDSYNGPYHLSPANVIMPQSSPKKIKPKPMTYKFYNYTPPSIGAFVAANGKPQKVITKSSELEALQRNPTKLLGNDSTTRAGSLQGQVSSSKVHPIKSFHSDESYRPRGQKRVYNQIKAITTAPILASPQYPPVSSTFTRATPRAVPSTLPGTMTPRTTTSPSRLSYSGGKVGLSSIQKPFDIERNNVSGKNVESELISYRSHTGSNGQNPRNFPYTQQLLINPCIQNYTVQKGKDTCTISTAAPTKTADNLGSHSLVYVQGINTTNIRAQPPPVRPGNSVVYRLAFPLASRMKGFNCSSLRPLLIKRNVNTSASPTMVSASRAPSFITPGVPLPKDDEPLDLSFKPSGRSPGCTVPENTSVNSYVTWPDVSKNVMNHVILNEDVAKDVPNPPHLKEDSVPLADTHDTDIDSSQDTESESMGESSSQTSLASDLSTNKGEVASDSSPDSPESGFFPKLHIAGAGKRRKKGKHRYFTGKRRRCTKPKKD